MIDGIKIKLPTSTAPALRASLDFARTVSESTGEDRGGVSIAELYGLRFILTPCTNTPGVEYVEVRGSLHRYARKGGHNGDRFTYPQLCGAVNDLCDLAGGVSPEDVTVHNLETGVNLALPFKAARLLRSFIAWGNTPVTNIAPVDGDGYEAHRKQHLLKLYDKGRQITKRGSSLARLEWKARKMEPVQRVLFGANRNNWRPVTLADMCVKTNLNKLTEHLADQYGSAIYYDSSIHSSNLTQGETLRLERYTSRRNWEADINADVRHRMKRGLARLIQLGGGNDIARMTSAAIRAEASALLSDQNQNLKPCASECADKSCAWNCADKTAMICPLVYEVNTSHLVNEEGEVIQGVWKGYRIKPIKGGRARVVQSSNNTLSGGANRKGSTSKSRGRSRKAQPATCCLTCGRNISKQRAGSLYCSSKTAGAIGARRCRDRGRSLRRSTIKNRKDQMSILHQKPRNTPAENVSRWSPPARSCKACGVVIDPRRPKAKFCPDPPKGTGSRCRDKWRRRPSTCSSSKVEFLKLRKVIESTETGTFDALKTKTISSRAVSPCQVTHFAPAYVSFSLIGGASNALLAKTPVLELEADQLQRSTSRNVSKHGADSLAFAASQPGKPGQRTGSQLGG